MYTRWDGLKVDWRCNDPRPPQMEPPDIYPEGQPFFDARPPQDQPDALVDGSTLQSVVGGIVRSVGVQAVYPTGQSANQPGDLSPLPILNAPAPTPAVSSTVATRTIRTGPVSAGGEQ